MKKILIVINNMKVGGVQKSLCNLLWELNDIDEYEITLLLFSPVGAYIDRLPPKVRCISCESLFRYLGQSQGEMHGVDKVKRGILAGVCRVLSRNLSIKLMLLSQRMLPETYDYAIAFLHNGSQRTFFGGVQDFVLHRVRATKKITFLHDDYNKCGANHRLNNKIMGQFDVIAACSEGCRCVFADATPQLAHRSVTVRNCNNIIEIRMLAAEDTVVYDKQYINIVCAARFSPRKGVDRAIIATEQMIKEGIPVRLHILGSGVLGTQLKEMVIERGLEKNIVFYGEQSNPYRYIKDADLFLLTSYHEAAPMVIDEAYILGIPTLATRTNSSDEMITERACGGVCENNQQSLNDTLRKILEDSSALHDKKAELCNRVIDNSKAVQQFRKLVEE